MRADPKSWTHHALIALGMMPLFMLGVHYLPRWSWPAVYATGIYLFREIDQAIGGGIARSRIVDGVLDVLVPGVVTLVVCGLLWASGVHW